MVCSSACILIFLSLIFFYSRPSDPEQEEEKSDSTKPALFKPSPEFLASFSTKFCLEITANVLKKIQGDMEKNHPLSFSALKQLGGECFEKLPSSMTAGDKLSYDQIWQDIMQNVAKGLNAKKYIFITHGELDRLEEQLSESDQIQGQRTLAVFFTCGHYYTKAAFEKELSRFSREMASGQLRLPETTSLLTEYYRRKSKLPLACPKCVLNAVCAM